MNLSDVTIGMPVIATILNRDALTFREGHSEQYFDDHTNQIGTVDHLSYSIRSEKDTIFINVEGKPSRFAYTLDEIRPLPTFEVGDMAKVIFSKPPSLSYNADPSWNNSIVVITEVPEDPTATYGVVDMDGRTNNVFLFALHPIDPPVFEVGDRVEVNADFKHPFTDGFIFNTRKGSMGNVSRVLVSEDRFPVRVILDNGQAFWFTPAQLKKIVPAPFKVGDRVLTNHIADHTARNAAYTITASPPLTKRHGQVATVKAVDSDYVYITFADNAVLMYRPQELIRIDHDFNVDEHVVVNLMDIRPIPNFPNAPLFTNGQHGVIKKLVSAEAMTVELVYGGTFTYRASQLIKMPTPAQAELKPGDRVFILKIVGPDKAPDRTIGKVGVIRKFGIRYQVEFEDERTPFRYYREELELITHGFKLNDEVVVKSGVVPDYEAKVIGLSENNKLHVLSNKGNKFFVTARFLTHATAPKYVGKRFHKSSVDEERKAAKTAFAISRERLDSVIDDVENLADYIASL